MIEEELQFTTDLRSRKVYTIIITESLRFTTSLIEIGKLPNRKCMVYNFAIREFMVYDFLSLLL